MLGQAEPVARVVTEHRLDSVRPLGWLLQERHATAGQLFIGLAAVVGLPDAPAELTSSNANRSATAYALGRHQG